MSIRLYNARILADPGNSPIIRGELHIRGGCIEYIGEPLFEAPPFEREIDLGGDLVMPGFKNAHSHSAMTFLRSFADDLPLQDWLVNRVFPLEKRLRGEDVYHLSRLAIMEYLSSGITSNFDMYYYPDEIARASVDCGFRTTLVTTVMAKKGDPERAERDFLRLNSMSELISCCLGFHAEYTASDEMLENLASIAKRHKSPIYAHNSETELEVAGCIERHGMTPTRYMDSFGLFEYGGGGYHCIYMSEEDMDIFKARGLYAVMNPGSNCKLASGIAPLCEMNSRGINLALGTDGPASNNCLDMFREMHLATVLQKLKLRDASAMPAETVLRMATVTGAEAMGLTDCNCLAPGKCADIVVIDMKRPNMQPENNIIKNIVFSGSKQNVRLTMVNGRVLYEDGGFSIGAEPEEIYARASEVTERIKKEV